MIDNNIIHYVEKLYKKIFHEDAINSKEFISFVNNNPHPLRIKVEDYIIDKISEEVIEIASATELDTFLTALIEDNYEC